jgi:predicted TIM-barrel fold metal-dependent hydrolase
MPLVVHNLSHQVPAGQRYPDSFLFQDTVGGSMETLHAFTGLMYGGIPEEFPSLRIAFFDIGAGWIPYMLERMDKDFASHGAEQAPLLKRSPSAYVKAGNWYYSTTGDEGTLPYVLDCIGDDIVVFGSRYPEADSLFPGAVSSVQTREDISEESKRKILSENAQRLFGLQ